MTDTRSFTHKETSFHGHFMGNDQPSYEVETPSLLELLCGGAQPSKKDPARINPARRVPQVKIRSQVNRRSSTARSVKIRTTYIELRRRPISSPPEPTKGNPDNNEREAATTSTPVLPIYEGLYELVQRDAVKQLRVMKSRFAGAMPSPENLVFAYAMAAVLRADVDEWQLFCMAPEWRRRRPRPSLSADNQENALFYVMRFLHGIGPNASLPVKQAMALLRSHWEQNVTPFDLHKLLMREEIPEPNASVAVRLMDGEFSRQFLTLPPGTKATVHLIVLPGKGRAKHVFEIAGVHAEPL